MTFNHFILGFPDKSTVPAWRLAHHPSSMFANAFSILMWSLWGSHKARPKVTFTPTGDGQ